MSPDALICMIIEGKPLITDRTWPFDITLVVDPNVDTLVLHIQFDPGNEPGWF